ncbi:lipoprotein [Bordetella trematum]|uniref:Lipoprotein n=1 Tax=Bordetella trematum TaxID=123899 RepID=A0A157K874_9BORD|nr:tripartite tricarboxylate transporter substrate binding protein [Bordetella trematum]SAH80580.1 lipoprotein [Bordetella trematum]SAI07556.1 lipoprotein [Bordetella trematum]SAI72560.1 lipoprotein [Bordetella trematum]SUV97763.1 lipoprotein [Bordetella trematum]
MNLRAALAMFVLAASQSASVVASPDAYPTRPITIIVPYAAGGTTDVMARALAKSLANQLKQPVVIENKPGVGGSMGVAAMQTAKPDGYTLTMTPVGIFRQPLLQTVPWDPIRDVTYLATVLTYDFALAVKADSPFKTAKELVDFAKKHPGEIDYGTPGRYTGNQVVLAMLGKREGVEFTHIPYKGDADAIAALMGGHVKAAVVTNSVLAQVKSGKVRVLATADDARNPEFQGVPTLKELGYDVIVQSPLGIGGPANLPAPIVEKLDNAIKAALDDNEVKTAAKNFGVRTYYLDHEAYAAFAKNEYESQKPLISDLGL